MALIPLSRGLFATVDDADLHLVADIKWHAHPNGRVSRNYYAVNGRGGAKPTIAGRRYMHRLILGAEPEQYVDHVNGDGLDNRRVNLRIATAADNARNATSKRPHGYRGIWLDRSNTKWRVRICVNYQTIRSSGFVDPVDAAREYDRLARLHHGEFAVLNFPEARHDFGPNHGAVA